MDIKKLNEELDKLLEDPISAIKNGGYTGDDIDSIVLANLNKFSVEDIVKIMQNKKYFYQGAGDLFPFSSGWKEGKKHYPDKLAAAFEIYTDLAIKRIKGPGESDVGHYYI